MLELQCGSVYTVFETTQLIFWSIIIHEDLNYIEICVKIYGIYGYQKGPFFTPAQPHFSIKQFVIFRIIWRKFLFSN